MTSFLDKIKPLCVCLRVHTRVYMCFKVNTNMLTELLFLNSNIILTTPSILFQSWVLDFILG